MSMPTVIAVFERNIDMTAFYSISEEEETHNNSFSEFKPLLKCPKIPYITFLCFNTKLSVIPHKAEFEQLRYGEVIIPPPENNLV